MAMLSCGQARIDLLMDLVTATNKNILLVGPAGVGKTLAINRFLKKTGENTDNKQSERLKHTQTCLLVCLFDFFVYFTDHESTIVKRLAFCPSTSSHSLHDFLDANMYHRQGLCLIETGLAICVTFFVSVKFLFTRIYVWSF